MNNSQEKKCSVIAICGSPNAGKSTLLNSIMGKKVSITSNKPQTTRNRVRAIKTIKATQLVFIDTPGIFKPKGKLNNRLNRSIVETARNSIDGADFIIFVFDSTKKFLENEQEIIKKISKDKARLLLVLNKIDLVDKGKLLEPAEKITKEANFEQVFMISAIDSDGTQDVLNYLIKNSPKSQWLYPEGYELDVESRVFAAEITREKLFNNLREELPYGVMVETEKYEEDKNIIIYQSIICVSEDHKKIIIGKKGALLKKIGQSARLELEKLWRKKVSLYLHVKVKQDWLEKRESYIIQNIDFTK